MFTRVLPALATAVMLAGLGVHPGAAAATDEELRTPPYDIGCLIVNTGGSPGPGGSLDRPCTPAEGADDLGPAREGNIQNGRFPLATVTFSIPPFPAVIRADAGTATGIRFDVAEASYIRISATLRNATPMDVPPSATTWACLGIYGGGIYRSGRGCQPVRAEEIVLTSTFEERVFDPGRQELFVYLVGCGSCLVTAPAQVLVESISYTITPARTLRVWVRGPGKGHVTTGDGKISCGPASGPCFSEYPEGAEVELTAVPEEDSVFQGWTGCERPEGTSCTVTLGSTHLDVEASFGTGGSAAGTGS